MCYNEIGLSLAMIGRVYVITQKEREFSFDLYNFCILKLELSIYLLCNCNYRRQNPVRSNGQKSMESQKRTQEGNIPQIHQLLA